MNEHVIPRFAATRDPIEYVRYRRRRDQYVQRIRRLPPSSRPGSGGDRGQAHGNRTNTRVSGSAEAIAQLGVNLEASVAALELCLRECRIAFLYAPNLHPAMRYAAAVRKQL
jgi:hypothetical protein